jgi:hypothetical protein
MEFDGILHSAEGIDIVRPRSWNDLLTFAKVLWKKKPSEAAQKYGDYYKTVGVDLLTECNFHLILDEVSNNKDLVTIQDWGIIGKKVKQFARMMVDLTDVTRYKQGPHVMICCLRKDVDTKNDTGMATGRIGPLLSGQCFDDVPGVFNLIVYLRMVNLPGPDGKAKRRRMFQLETDGVYMAGTRYPGALAKYEPPDISHLWDKIQAWRHAKKEVQEGATA